MSKSILIAARGLGLGGIEASLIALLEYLDSRDCTVVLLLEEPGGALMERVPSSIRVVRTRRSNLIARLQARLAGLRTRPLSQILANPMGLDLAKRLANYLEYRSLHALVGKFTAARWYTGQVGRFDIAISYSHFGMARYVVHKVDAHKKYMWFHQADYARSGLRKRRDLRYYGAFDRIVAVSGESKKVLTREFPSLSDKVLVMSNPLNPSRIIELAEEPLEVNSEAGLVLLTVSRLRHEKGLDIALRAAAILKAGGLAFQWFFIGEGRDLEALLTLRSELALGDHCHFLGSRSNPFPLMLHADIYVQPSRIEAECLAVREAMVLAKPIVATDLPPIRTLLRNATLGTVVQAEPSQFAHAITRLSDAEVRKQYSDRLTSLSPADHVRGTEEALDELFGLARPLLEGDPDPD